MTPRPNFFIIGAPKCGTTAMSEYLRTHPNVFMSKLKEPHFFSSDIINSPYVRNVQEYLDLFRAASREQYMLGEASADYLMSKVAVEKIASFSPDSKIVIMLRRPSELVRSFHNQLVKHGVECVLDFEEAWNLQVERSQGRNLPRNIRFPKLLQYKMVGEIGTQVKRVVSIFPRDRVHIIFFDDFSVDPRGEYYRLLTFLGLHEDDREDFPRVNESIQYRWLWLGQLPKRLRGYVAKPLTTLRLKTGFRGIGLIKMLDRFNTVPAQRPPLSIEFRRYLDEVFSDEVSILEELLGRDLSAWRAEPLDNTKPRNTRWP
jgi:hypothetical protein